MPPIRRSRRGETQLRERGTIMMKPRQGQLTLPRRVEGQPLTKKLLAERAEVLGQFLLRVGQEVGLTETRRQQLQLSAHVMPGLSVIEVPASLFPAQFADSPPNFLMAWQDSELPPLTITEPMFGSGPSALWHLNTIGYVNKASDGNGVKVGVIDFGYDPQFPDLQDAGFAPPFVVWDYAQNAMVPSTPFDPTWTRHGSKVCAMLAGQSCGVARGANYAVAGILPTSPPNLVATAFMVVRATEWLVAAGCDIITTSINTSDYGVTDPNGIVATSMSDAAAAGALVVAAIGNGGTDAGQEPGAIPNVVIGVGALNEYNEVPSFSATLPPKPDILAPGAYLEFPDGYGGHISDSGTSFAAPIVAGAAALYLQNNMGARYDVPRIRAGVLALANNAAQHLGAPVLDLITIP